MLYPNRVEDYLASSTHGIEFSKESIIRRPVRRDPGGVSRLKKVVMICRFDRLSFPIIELGRRGPPLDLSEEFSFSFFA